MHEMRVIGQQGDVKVSWDPDKADEVKAAQEMFIDLVIRKKYLAFKMLLGMDRGEQIREFDASYTGIILVPPMAGG